MSLSIVLESGDDVLESIRKAILGHGIEDCKIVEGFGKVTKSWLIYFEGNKFKSRAIDGEPIVGASAHYKKDKRTGGLEGDLHVRVAVGNSRITGTLTRGKALGELSFKATFVQIEK